MRKQYWDKSELWGKNSQLPFLYFHNSYASINNEECKARAIM